LSVVNHFISTLQRPIVCIHDSFVCYVRDTGTLIILMADCYRILMGDNISMRDIKSTFQEVLCTTNRCYEQML
jgi:hypothetical protein